MMWSNGHLTEELLWKCLMGPDAWDVESTLAYLTGNNSKVCRPNSKVRSYSGEESHSCGLAVTACLIFQHHFATAAHALLDKNATGPLPLMDDRQHQVADDNILIAWKHWWERESNMLCKFRSPSLHLPPCPLDHRSWIRFNRGYSLAHPELLQLYGRLVWLPLHAVMGCVRGKRGSIADNDSWSGRVPNSTSGGWFTKPRLPKHRS
ncbi:uncharacterized protein LOC117874880 [Trachemys scripta elegans]|uniref:uncharacterized protein LOC117874880 n=1 Tax=Trachemys scripta elegans TaxID=31138 RepID=UPI0015559306|nr:uncharacterized protein LOC117874880 [Trachemys scripta elegans]